jgi:hypothetical protein
MIIKRWDTTLNNGNGGWAEQYPKTVAQNIFDSAGTTAVFDSNNKIKPTYLPDAVFDSLFFFSTISNAVDIRVLGVQAVQNAASIGRSAVGYYWVASSSAGPNSSTGTIQTGSPSVYVTTSGINPSEEGISSGTGVTLETGDWIVITKVNGLGTLESPYSFTFATINNTYALMTGATSSANGAPGIVPTPLVANKDQFLKGDGTWATPTYINTTYTIGTANGDDIYKEKINLSGSDSSTDTVQIAVGATTLIVKTATVTNGSANILISDTSRLLPGQLVTGAGIPANTLITQVIENTQITVSNAATASGSSISLTFSTFGLTIEQASDIITVKHADTSSTSNLAATARTYVTGLTFDTFGHVIGYTTGSETVVDTNTEYTAGNGIALSAQNEFSVAGGEGLTQEASGLKMTYPVYHGDTLPTTGISPNAIGLEW